MNGILEFMGMHMKLTIGVISFILTEIFLISMIKTKNERLEKILMTVSLVGMGIFTLDIVGSIVYYILSWISLNIKKISIVQSRDDAMMLFLVGVFAVLTLCVMIGRAADRKSSSQGIDREVESMTK